MKERMSFKFIYLNGSPLLTMAKKLLLSQNKTVFEFFESQINGIIEQNFEGFMERVNKKNVKFEEFSGLDMYFNSLKNKFLKSKIKGKDFIVD